MYKDCVSLALLSQHAGGKQRVMCEENYNKAVRVKEDYRHAKKKDVKCIHLDNYFKSVIVIDCKTEAPREMQRRDLPGFLSGDKLSCRGWAHYPRTRHSTSKLPSLSLEIKQNKNQNFTAFIDTHWWKTYPGCRPLKQQTRTPILHVLITCPLVFLRAHLRVYLWDVTGGGDLPAWLSLVSAQPDTSDSV